MRFVKRYAYAFEVTERNGRPLVYALINDNTSAVFERNGDRWLRVTPLLGSHYIAGWANDVNPPVRVDDVKLTAWLDEKAGTR